LTFYVFLSCCNTFSRTLVDTHCWLSRACSLQRFNSNSKRS